MRARLSEEAERELADINAHLSEEWPSYAVFALGQIQRAFDRLGVFPHIGRPAKYPGIRQFVVTRTSYIIDYIVLGDTVWVLHIRHAAMKWPPGDDE